MNHPELTCGILQTCNRNILEQTKKVQKMYLFFYQSTIITFLATKTNNKKLKIFIKKQLTKHYITLLPFILIRQQRITKKSTDTLIYSKYYRCICIIGFFRFIANIWNEL